MTKPTEIYIDEDNGSDEHGDGSQEKPFRTSRGIFVDRVNGIRFYVKNCSLTGSSRGIGLNDERASG